MQKIYMLIIIVFISSCAHFLRTPASVSSDGLLHSETFTEEVFEQLPKIGGSTYFKFVVLPDAQGRWTQLRMIDTRQYAFHYQYLGTTPQFKNFTFKQVEAVSLKKENRQVILGTAIVRHDFTEGRWDYKTSYLLTTTEVPDVAIQRSVQKLLEDWCKGFQDDSLAFSKPYVFTPQPQQMAEATARKDEFAKQDIKFRMPDQTSPTAVYTSGWGIGKIGIYPTRADVEAGIQSGLINQDSIIVIGSDLPELPPVAGVISEVPLTEASHLVLLAQMYGIPLVYEKSAVEKYTKLNSQISYLSSKTENDDFEFFKDLSPSDISELKQLKHKSKLQVQVNWIENRIMQVDSLKPTDVTAYGGKGMQFGIIRRTVPNNTRSVVVGIPLHYYKKFITQATLPSGESLQAALGALLKTIPQQPQYALVNEKMEEARELFKSAQISPDFFQQIRVSLQKYFPAQASTEVRLKIRSSSNVEDGAEFNGAGLYDSEGVCLTNCKKDDFAKGLIKVWSSLYSTRGYWARVQFGVDESKVGMGLVAHAPYKSETVNGVVRFKYVKNYNNEQQSKVEVLSVPGEELSVTNADQGGLNEKVNMTEDKIDNLRPFKNAPEGRLLMDPQHYATLVNLMKKLYVQRPNPAVEEIEAEWKLIVENGSSVIHIKQVRAVPKLTQSKFANGIKFKVYTGQDLNFVGGWPGDSRSMSSRIEKMVVTMGNFTDQDFYNSKIKIQSAKMQIQGQIYDLQVKAHAVEIYPDYVDAYNVTLTNPILGDYIFTFTVSKNMTNSILTGKGLSYALKKEVKDSAVHYHIALSEKNAAPLLYKDFVQQLSPKKLAVSQKSCPVKINGAMSKRWVVGDNEYRNLDRVEISGLLPNKPVVVTVGYPFANYFYQQHETRYDAFIDLFADPQLTAAQKSVLLKNYGRYLWVDQNDLIFYDSNNKNGKKIKGCTDFMYSEDENEQGEGGEDDHHVSAG